MIIDLDADIKADTMMTSREKVESCAPPAGLTNGSSLTNNAYDAADCDKSLKMKIKRTKSGRQEIVKQEGGTSDSDNSSSRSPSPSPTPPPSSQSLSASPPSPSNNRRRLKVIITLHFT